MTEYSITRSMDATTARATARASRERLAHANGWWGMLIFVLTEATLFIMLFATYYYLRFRNVHWPPPGVPEPKVLVPALLTGVLLGTSVLMQSAVAAARRADLSFARLALAGAALVQAAYLVAQIHLFLDDLDKFQPSGSAYASIYFVLLGTHHTHVLVGVLLNAWLLLRLLPGITNYRFVGLHAATLYWHFVNLAAIPVLLTQIFPRL